MELRTYLHILRRRWWIPVLLVLLTLVVTLVTQRPWQPRPPAYALGMAFSLGVRPADSAGNQYDYDGYYTALASEYLIDDFSEIVKGSEFAAAVTKRLQAEGIDTLPGAIQGSTQAGKLHRILQVTLYGGDAAALEKLADAVSATLIEDADQFMPRLQAERGAVYLINRGTTTPIGPGLRERLDLPLRLVLALLVGIGLVFLLEYLDNRVRDRAQLEALGIPVIGEIPQRR